MNMMMYLDRKKAIKLLKEELKKKEKIARACLTLRGDEFWNSETIYENGKNVNQKDFKCYFGSYWATPCLRIEYKDGKEKHIDCYFTKEENPELAEKKEAENTKKREKSVKKIKKLLVKIKRVEPK